MSVPDEEPTDRDGGARDDEVLRGENAYHGGAVSRRGNVVLRDSKPWTATVHTLLHHLEAVGFAGAPRVVGTGFDQDGRETLSYIEGQFTQPGPWTLAGAAAVGRLIRQLHDATASYPPPRDAVWMPWAGRALGGDTRVIGHCDAAPWNIVARDGLPVAIIDWERAGPVDPLVELAQVCWLNAKLHDDVVAELEGLPPLLERARQLRAMVDAYGLALSERRGFLDLMIEFVVSDTAEQADDAGVTPETTPDNVAPELVWALSWRARAAAWLYRNHRTLQNALT